MMTILDVVVSVCKCKWSNFSVLFNQGDSLKKKGWQKFQKEFMNSMNFMLFSQGTYLIILVYLCYRSLGTCEVNEYQKVNSPEWSAQYSGSDPSGRQHKCRRGQSCSVPAAEIRDQTFRYSVSSCLLSTVAGHSACYAECQMKSLEKLLTVFCSDSYPLWSSHGWQLTPPQRWEGQIYTEIDLMQKLESLQ